MKWTRWVAVAFLALSLVLAVVPQGEQPRLYVAGREAGAMYHADLCPWAQRLDAENLRFFQSQGEARDAGCSPCPTCHP